MSEEKKTNKRRLVARYLLLAAAILLVAAITVVSVFAANGWFRTGTDINLNVDDDTNGAADDASGNGGTDDTDDADNSSDNTDDTGDSGANDDTADDADDEPANTATTWLTPVATVDVINSYDFIQDVTLMNSWHMHEAIDFAAEAGTDVVCCMDGTVEKIVLGDQLDGNYVKINHGNGVYSIYTYIDVAEGLEVGDDVKRGQTLGTVSEATGAECLLTSHLHFAVEENGTLANPENYLEITAK